MSKIKEEADLHKDLPQNKLKRVIWQYRFLSIANTEIFNFVFYLITFGVPVLCMLGITIATLFLMLLIHFAFFWLFLFKYKNFKLVSDEDRYEIDEIVKILEDYLKENKKPLK